MPLQPTKNIWHNGKLVPWDQAQIHVMSHVIHYGSSVFEGIRCYKTEQGAAIFRLQDHMQRMLDSAKIYRMDLGYSLDQVNDAVSRPSNRMAWRRVISVPSRFAVTGSWASTQ